MSDEQNKLPVQNLVTDNNNTITRQFMRIDKPQNESNPNFVYHITNEERANLIAEQGILTHKPYEFTDQETWPDGSTQKRNYFTPTAQNSYQFAPEEGKPVLLRINKNDHDFRKESYTGDLFSTKIVSPTKIEYLNNEGNWFKLKEKEKLTKKPKYQRKTIPKEFEF